MNYETICDSRDRAAWLAARNSGIGASEIPAVLEEDPWTSALELYDRKVNPQPPESEEDERAAKPWLWVGRRIEDFSASLYMELTGREIRPAGQLVRSKEHSWMLATLDYQVVIDGEWCPLEIKNVGATKAAEWVDGAPPRVHLQGQQQGIVTDSHKTSFFALIGGNTPVWCDVDADDVARNRIIYHGSRFWERVKSRQPPLPDGSDSAARTIARMYPDTSDQSVQLGRAESDMTDEIATLKKQRREIDSQVKVLEQQIKSRIGSAEYGVLPDGRVWSYRTVERAEHVVAVSKYRKVYLHETQPKRRYRKRKR